MTSRTGTVRRLLQALFGKSVIGITSSSDTRPAPVLSAADHNPEQLMNDRSRRFFLKRLGFMLVGLAALKVEIVAAVQKLINNIRLWRSPDKTRLVFDVSGAVTHKRFHLDNPSRLVIDVSDARLSGSLTDLQLKGTPIQKIRYGTRNQQDYRIVLDLSERVTSESFLLNPNATYGHRLVIDLFDEASKKAVPAHKPQPAGQRDIIIAIDAGHGGEDPGALAHGGGYEKHVTLAIAKDLAALLQREKGFKPVLVRTGDYYIDLRRRTQIARENKADLFISIHADGFKDRRVKGASVFAWSQKGATSQMARWLEARENETDKIGGEARTSFNDDDMLNKVLFDLSITSSRALSIEVGDKVLMNMSGINRLHKKHVDLANFMVLKSPDIPSILIETGFITNPEESRKLKSRSHQKAMAKAIFDGTKHWFHQKPPPDTLIARMKQDDRLKITPSRYTVRPGDTLSGIASRFDVSTKLLKRANRLTSANKIRVGQVLVIPK